MGVNAYSVHGGERFDCRYTSRAVKPDGDGCARARVCVCLVRLNLSPSLSPARVSRSPGPRTTAVYPPDVANST